MHANLPVVVAPIAAATAAPVEPRPFLHDLARTTVIYVVTYVTLVGISLYHYV